MHLMLSALLAVGRFYGAPTAPLLFCMAGSYATAPRLTVAYVLAEQLAAVFTGMGLGDHGNRLDMLDWLQNSKHCTPSLLADALLLTGLAEQQSQPFGRPQAFRACSFASSYREGASDLPPAVVQLLLGLHHHVKLSAMPCWRGALLQVFAPLVNLVPALAPEMGVLLRTACEEEQRVFLSEVWPALLDPAVDWRGEIAKVAAKVDNYHRARACCLLAPFYDGDRGEQTRLLTEARELAQAHPDAVGKLLLLEAVHDSAALCEAWHLMPDARTLEDQIQRIKDPSEQGCAWVRQALRTVSLPQQSDLLDRAVSAFSQALADSRGAGALSLHLKQLYRLLARPHPALAAKLASAVRGSNTIDPTARAIILQDRGSALLACSHVCCPDGSCRSTEKGRL